MSRPKVTVESDESIGSEEREAIKRYFEDVVGLTGGKIIISRPKRPV